MNGYTSTIDRETKRHNELHATVEIVVANPDNKFWQNRLAAVRDNIDTDHLAELVDICNTDPAHILNTGAEADWLQANGSAGQYGERAYISGGEVCYLSDMVYRPASEPDDDMPF